MPILVKYEQFIRFLMSARLRRNLVLITALIYLVFACSYVILCRRNTTIINLLDCFKFSASANVVKGTIKIESQATSPISHKFLSRPRVVFKRFSVAAILTVIVPLWILSFCRTIYIGLPIAPPVFNPSRRLVFLQNWRI